MSSQTVSSQAVWTSARRVGEALRVAMLAVLVLACLDLAGATAQADDRPVDGLTGYDDALTAWIEAIGRTEESELFAGLTADRAGVAAREEFLWRFWQARGLDEPTERGEETEDRDAWIRTRGLHLRFVDAVERFGDLRTDRAVAYLLAGPPARTVVFGGCRGIVRPMRFWWYDRRQAEALLGETAVGPGVDGFWLAFARRREAGGFAAWWPGDGTEALSESDAPFARSRVEQLLDLAREGHCFRKGEDEAQAVAQALGGAWSLDRVERLFRARLAGDAERARWLDDFADALLARAEEKEPKTRYEPVGASLALHAAGHSAGETVVRARLRLPTALLWRSAGGEVFDRLTVRGETLHGASVVDAFVHVFHVVGTPPGDAIELDVWRRIRPADVRIRLRLEDAAGRALLRREDHVRVPPKDHPAPDPAGHLMGLAGLTRDDVLTVVTFPQLQIVSPGIAQMGVVPIDVRTQGDRAVDGGGTIERVEMLLDGRPAGSDDEAPWRVEVDLGGATGDKPQARALEAIAYDAEGRELARDALRFDPGPRPFHVELRLSDGMSDGAGEGRRSAAVRVALPASGPQAEVDTIELWVGDRLLARRSPPSGSATVDGFEVDFDLSALALAPDVAAALARAAFVRAVVRLEDGRVAEDFRFLRGEGVEEMDVRLVEVWASVTDRRGRPLTGLGADDFRVLDEGEEAPLRRVEQVADLPIQVLLLMDTSTSMRGRLPVAVASARRFFDTVLRGGDLAALLTFDDDLRLQTPFTGDPGLLALGASGLDPDGGTRLHDALVWSLGYLGGSRRTQRIDPGEMRHRPVRRALVLLSDGRDVGSDSPFDQALEQAVNAGVAVYPILLAVGDGGTRSDLVRLARDSGGRAFAIDSADELDGVYARIEEELRSQYLLVFQSVEARRGVFRRIELQVVRDGAPRPGLDVRSIRGYYR